MRDPSAPDRCKWILCKDQAIQNNAPGAAARKVPVTDITRNHSALCGDDCFSILLQKICDRRDAEMVEEVACDGMCCLYRVHAPSASAVQDRTVEAGYSWRHREE